MNAEPPSLAAWFRQTYQLYSRFEQELHRFEQELHRFEQECPYTTRVGMPGTYTTRAGMPGTYTTRVCWLCPYTTRVCWLCPYTTRVVWEQAIHHPGSMGAGYTPPGYVPQGCPYTTRVCTSGMPIYHPGSMGGYTPWVYPTIHTHPGYTSHIAASPLPCLLPAPCREEKPWAQRG